MRSARELELTEGAMIALVVAALTTLGLTLWLGTHLAGERTAGGEPAAVSAVDDGGERQSILLPRGFIGPPPPPSPPIIGGAPGRGASAGVPWTALELERTATRRLAERRVAALLARGLPAYVGQDDGDGQVVRVGDYATTGEAEHVKGALARAGIAATVIRGKPPRWLGADARIGD